MHDEDEKEQIDPMQQQAQQHQELAQQAEEEQEAQEAQDAEHADAGAAWFEQLRQRNAELMEARVQEREHEQEGPEC